MNFDDIERILELVREHDLAEFELEKEGLKLRVRKNATEVAQVMQQMPLASPMPLAMAAAAQPVGLPPALAPALPVDDGEIDLAIVKSPIVGTFYRSAEPGAAAFVDVGDKVRKDQVLCIIEAMKLMNEITSEYEGEIVSVYVENGKAVQYGERLFAIKTA